MKRPKSKKNLSAQMRRTQNIRKNRLGMLEQSIFGGVSSELNMENPVDDKFLTEDMVSVDSWN